MIRMCFLSRKYEQKVNKCSGKEANDEAEAEIMVDPPAVVLHARLKVTEPYRAWMLEQRPKQNSQAVNSGCNQ